MTAHKHAQRHPTTPYRKLQLMSPVPVCDNIESISKSYFGRLTSELTLVKVAAGEKPAHLPQWRQFVARGAISSSCWPVSLSILPGVSSCYLDKTQ